MAMWASAVCLVACVSLTTGVRQNVARGKPAWMSTTRQASQSAGNAVDGVTTADGERYSAHTRVNETTAWWKVDLQTPVQSAQVNVYFRTDYKRRRNGLQLYTSMTNSSDPKDGDLCHTVSGSRYGTDIPDTLNVTCPGAWRYLTVYTETDNDGDGAVLDFVEVQVWVSTACASGNYGTNCGKSCAARHCKMDSVCDVTSGQCVGGCAAGYQGTDCRQACATGYYGVNCGQSCTARHCKMDSSCDVTHGQCVGGCATGYQGTDCRQACDHGKYGEGCRKTCSNRHCKTSSDFCYHVTGTCPDGCIPGFSGEDCLQNCPEGYYGSNCSLSCAGRHCSSSFCPADGACDTECEAGWTLKSCTQECPRGKYGTSCNSVCGHCADNIICDHITGTCTGGCKAGWKLPLCQTVCDNGTFGLNCERDCGQCSGTCDAVDGRCPWGCNQGYNGSHCSMKLSSLRNSNSALAPVTVGVIGLVAGICLSVVLGVGILVCLVRQGRLQWVNSAQNDEVKVRATSTQVDRNSTQPSDNYTSISEQADARNIYNNDYSILDVEAKSNNDYDVIKDKAYENM